MSVITVTPDLVEMTTLVLQPSQSFSSSSSGLTGSIRLASKPSYSFLSFSTSGFGDEPFSEGTGITDDDDLLYTASVAYTNIPKILELYQNGTINVIDYLVLRGLAKYVYAAKMEEYFESVSTNEVDQTQFLETYPLRFSPPSFVEEYTYSAEDEGGVLYPRDPNEWKINARKCVKDLLIPAQLVENPYSRYGYGNYNSLNFVSSSNFGTASAIIYPNFPDAALVRQYSPQEEFTLDFFIKPKAPVDDIGHFRAGTIFHVSSSICVSLISGSSLGPDSQPETFRILLQLSQSADRPPSLINPDSLPLPGPGRFTYVTDDILYRDTWHRVTIRWGAASRNFGTGSISVDTTEKKFAAGVTSISSSLSANALVLGNYYDSGDDVGKFFNSVDAANYGTTTDPNGSTTDPEGFKFSHPLNAELHHISLFKRYLTTQDLKEISDLYVSLSARVGPCFYVSPFFVPYPYAAAEKTYFTPNYKALSYADSPISYQMALGYNATYINLQNFIYDIAGETRPRAYGMSEGIEIPVPIYSKDGLIDDLLMFQTANRRRNFTILPCDDGNFEPDFRPVERLFVSSALYASTVYNSERFSSFGNQNIYHMISMENLAPFGTYIPGVAFGDFSYDGSDYPYLPLFQDINYNSARSSYDDRSSNLVTIFSIPSAYYQNRIIPGSFVITDSNVSKSGGLSFTLKDDGRGNLYRCDTRSTPSKWNRVGAIFYAHGIVAILTPHLPFFGKNSFEVQFKGEVRKTVANITVPASPGIANASSNLTYKSFPPTNLRSEQAEDFTYITGINLHDQNLNVVMRARLAQPVQKREGDEIVFRLRYDF